MAQQKVDSLRSREDYILNASVHKKGIYKTFDEFKYNSPSIVDNYTFDGKRLWLTEGQTGKQRKIKKREIWGFCDGDRVFVSWRKYDELLEYGRYCYFREKGVRVAMAFSMTPPMPIPIPLPYKDQLIINYNTGITYRLTKRLMKRILETDDQELMTEFKNQTHKKKKLFEYVLKYNKRNASKIK